jgi:hypothetical protein
MGDMPFVDVLAGAVTSYETDRLDTRVITDGVYSWDSPMNDIDDTWGKPCSLTKFSNDHRCTRITL